MYENRRLVTPDTFRYYKMVGDSLESPRILIGECALARRGLTSLLSETMQLSTLYTDITGLSNFIVQWYFNPFADKYMHCTPSIQHPMIMEPDRERALIEYIIFHDYFNEGILIEGLQNYLWHNDGNYDKLAEVGKEFHLQRSYIDYWVNEAINDATE